MTTGKEGAMTKILEFLKAVWKFVVDSVVADYNSRKK
jgi:hypothetical protein